MPYISSPESAKEALFKMLRRQRRALAFPFHFAHTTCLSLFRDMPLFAYYVSGYFSSFAADDDMRHTLR